MEMFCIVKDTPDPRCEYTVMNDRHLNAPTKWSAFDTKNVLTLPFHITQGLADKLEFSNARALPASEVLSQIERQRIAAGK